MCALVGVSGRALVHESAAGAVNGRTGNRGGGSVTIKIPCRKAVKPQTNYLKNIKKPTLLMFHKILRLVLNILFFPPCILLYTRVCVCTQFFLSFYDHDVDRYFTIRNEARPFSELYVPPRRFLWDAERKKKSEKTRLFTQNAHPLHAAADRR